jgi:tRNA pseudouridine55 synthase
VSRTSEPLNGVLPVDKPEGPTSHDVVARARRALGERRAGHTGTLDPFASGLLLLCVGPSTRLAEYLTALPKRYRATLRLGLSTDTDDRTGAPISRSEAWTSLPEAAVRAALEDQRGERLQLPPRYSAKKVGGERLYAAARRGEEVEREPARVVIHSLEVLEIALPEVEFEVECSSGTYIRAIARDAGEALGVGAHLTRLRRTRIGGIDVDGALGLERLGEPDAVRAVLLPPRRAVSHLPQVVLDEDGLRALSHGRPVPAPPALAASAEALPIALLAPDGALAAFGVVRGEVIHPRKVFA